jgi:hypothetical protein
LLSCGGEPLKRNVMRLSKPLKFLLDLVKSVGLYLIVVVGGTVGFLSLAPVVGYVPYSDRPGSGWFGRFPAISWAEFVENVQFMVDWAQLFVWHAIILALLIFLLARGLELVRAPRLVVAIICAVVSAFFTGFLVAAAGWYIAIGAAAVYFAMFLALVFGALLLPKRIARIGDA